MEVEGHRTNMKIKIKNKNNNQEYEIADGSVITENYNETLDSATIIISNLTEKIDLMPYDKAILIDEEGRLKDRYMCVDTYIETMVSVSPKIYQYQLTLFSETKELEGIILPNLSITQISGEKRSIYDYILYYVNEYSPKLRYGTKTSYSLSNAFNIAPRVGTKFVDDCPEKQWSQPTLREVLTDLMMVKDCIPVLKNGVIDYIDLSEKKDDITDNAHINYIQSSQSSEDYVSELKMNMVNVMNTSINGVNNIVSRTEFVPFDCNDYVLTSENQILTTQFPILRVKHLYMCFNVDFETEDAGSIPSPFYCLAVKDLCNLKGKNDDKAYSLVAEKQEFNVKNTLYKTDGFDDSKIENYSKYQNTCVYFSRFGNTIESWGDQTVDQVVFGSQYKSKIKLIMKAISNLCCEDIIAQLEKEYGAKITRANSDTSYYYYNVFFKIEYETTADAVFQASKDEPLDNSRVVVDNQTDNFVEAYNQGFLEYQKANRLGNQQLVINARYENDYDNLIKIGDYYDDSIIYQVQYNIFKSYISVNAIATKNYILKNYYTGIKAKVRSWKIASGNEALTRHELDKYYCEFSFNQKTEDITLSNDLAYYMLSPFYQCETQPIKYCIIKIYDKEGKYYPTELNYYYSVDLSSRIIGNSIVFTYGFEDNFSAGKNVDVSVCDFSVNQVVPNKAYGGIPLQALRYVDNNGECEEIDYNLCYAVDTATTRIYDGFHTQYGADLVDLKKELYQRPLIPTTSFENYVKLKGKKEYHKDNKEILKCSQQYEFCSDTHDIRIGKKFLQLQQAVRTIDQAVRSKKYTIPVSVAIADLLPTIKGDAYVGTYDVPSDDVLKGKILTDISISGNNTLGAYTNSVSFNSETGKFTGNVYSLKKEKITATITYYNNDSLFKVYKGNSDDFDFKNYSLEKAVIDETINVLINKKSEKTCKIILSGATDIETSCFYITDINDNILLVINKHNNCYLNVLKSRNCNIYNSDGYIVDTIIDI